MPTPPMPWELAEEKSLLELLTRSSKTTKGGCVWIRASVDEGDAAAAAAWIVADEVMALRCGGNKRLYDEWSAVARGTSPPSDSYRQEARWFIRPSFGVPGDELPETHAMGYVAQVVWYLMVRDGSPAERTILELPKPDSAVTAPGGDGFIVFEPGSGGEPHFRLWEIKKTNRAGKSSAVAGKGVDQLKKRGAEYLAKRVGESEIEDGPLAALYADLVKLWLTGDARSGAGVAVATGARDLPTRCFGGMHKRFPLLTQPEQLEGLLLGLGSLQEFTKAVRGHLWTGL